MTVAQLLIIVAIAVVGMAPGLFAHGSKLAMWSAIGAAILIYMVMLL